MNYRKRSNKYFRLSYRDTLTMVIVFAAAFAVCFILQRFSSNDFHVPLIFVLVVFVISRLTEGYLYGILSSVVGVIAVNYAFTYPYFQFNFTLTGYPLTFLTMLVVSFATCTMTSQIKRQEKYIVEGEKEKIRANLLRGISHDLRTPLTSIIGSANALMENGELEKDKRERLLKDINDEAQWLLRMVENVLSVTRISSSSYDINKEPEIAEEAVGEAIAKFKKQYPDVQFSVRVPDEVFFVPMDALLIEQVLLNIFFNSAEHGGCSRIDIIISKTKDSAVFDISDNGCGFAGEILEKQDTPELLGRSDKDKYMGIGLSVCRTIIKAHKGKMKLSNGDDGGAKITLLLPTEEVQDAY